MVDATSARRFESCWLDVQGDGRYRKSVGSGQLKPVAHLDVPCGCMLPVGDQLRQSMEGNLGQTVRANQEADVKL
ncbi:hypothetical protein RRG08_032961 [Elysia crispata]|uniref:Uncharacterized protein n=1 Tax=Elysia crispata TaxID=231223 RepID=A0AAE0YRT9_9GAST|nr:hypothetical protein RRG08_032961 [Elysia crispata]